MTHGGIAGWKKKEGEFVATGDIIADIQTDKATMEMESMEEGWMAKIIVPEGTEDIPVGKPVAVLCEEQADIAAFKDYVPEASADARPPPRRSPPEPCSSDPTTDPSANEACRSPRGWRASPSRTVPRRWRPCWTPTRPS